MVSQASNSRRATKISKAAIAGMTRRSARSVQNVDVDGQVIETLGAAQAGQFADRSPQHGGQQLDAQPRQAAQGRIVRGQPFAVARRRAAESQSPDAGTRPEDIEDKPRAAPARPCLPR